jgi:hypothetical protein
MVPGLKVKYVFCNVLILCTSSYREFYKAQVGFHTTCRLVESLAPKHQNLVVMEMNLTQMGI